MDINRDLLCTRGCLESLKFIEKDNKYFLDITMVVHDVKDFRFNTIVELPIIPSNFSVSTDWYGHKFVDIGFGKLPCVDGLTYKTLKEGK